MRKLFLEWFALLFLYFSTAIVVSAQEFVLGAGSALFNDDTTPTLSVEYHGKTWREFGRVQLRFGGAFAVDENGSFWAGAGLSGTVGLGRKWFGEFSFFPGYFNAGSTATRLGSNIAFRSLIGLGYRVSDCAAVSIAVDHRSNAGLDGFNPGVNSVSLRWHRRF